jgi:hypothetical protein
MGNLVGVCAHCNLVQAGLDFGYGGRYRRRRV